LNVPANGPAAFGGQAGLPPQLDDELVWCEVRRHTRARKAGLFLDRDGVVVEEIGYLHKPEETRLVPGAAAVIASANEADIPVVIVTNQAGIGRGKFVWADFVATQLRIIELLAREGASFDAVFACPHVPGGAAPYGHDDHPARKPNPGMLQRAISALDLNQGASWIVGDRIGDMMAGEAAGLAGGVLVDSGIGNDERHAAGEIRGAQFELRKAGALADAADLIERLSA